MSTPVKSQNEFDEEEDTFMTRLSHILITERRKGLGYSKEITLVINTLQEAFKKISQQVRRYGLFSGIQVGRLSFKSFDQKNLLRKCEAIFSKHLTASPAVCLMSSLYGNDIFEAYNHDHGKFIVAFVPIEGNPFLNYSLVSGSIFSIYKKQNKDPMCKEDLMQNGSAMLCAGYALYGQNTVFVLAPASGAGVYEFTLDPDTKEFILSNSKLEIPIYGSVYTMNEGRARAMDQIVLEAINKKKSLHNSRGRPLKCRYTGSTVADAHTIIKEGGILIAPPFNDYPEGMLRQQFIGNPLAFIAIEAGGAASDGSEQLLEISVDDPHQNRPLYLGSIKEHYEFIRILNGTTKTAKISTAI